MKFFTSRNVFAPISALPYGFIVICPRMNSSWVDDLIKRPRVRARAGGDVRKKQTGQGRERVPRRRGGGNADARKEPRDRDPTRSIPRSSSPFVLARENAASGRASDLVDGGVHQRGSRDAPVVGGGDAIHQRG